MHFFLKGGLIYIFCQMSVLWDWFPAKVPCSYPRRIEPRLPRHWYRDSGFLMGPFPLREQRAQSFPRGAHGRALGLCDSSALKGFSFPEKNHAKKLFCKDRGCLSLSEARTEVPVLVRSGCVPAARASALQAGA